MLEIKRSKKLVYKKVDGKKVASVTVNVFSYPLMLNHLGHGAEKYELKIVVYPNVFTDHTKDEIDTDFDIYHSQTIAVLTEDEINTLPNDSIKDYAHEEGWYGEIEQMQEEGFPEWLIKMAKRLRDETIREYEIYLENYKRFIKDS